VAQAFRLWLDEDAGPTFLSIRWVGPLVCSRVLNWGYDTMAGMMAGVTAAVLAGGLGTRLRPALADCPKVLAPVGGRPFLTYILDQLAAAGLREVVLLTGYMGEMVRAAVGETYAGLRLLYSNEPSPLGTAGALRWAFPRFSSSTILVLNGDSYCKVNLTRFSACHTRRAAEVTMLLAETPDASRFGIVQLGADDRVVEFDEKKTAGTPGLVNAGIYLIGRSLIEEIPSGRPASLERDVFPMWAGRKGFYGFRSPAQFLDIGTPASLHEAAAFFSPLN
jgi:NDP-sugar pyrophosphorylase family protein